VGPPMEAYLNDPGELSVDEYLTEVMVPVRQPS
jgi:effector-binding domain-containing protein